MQTPLLILISFLSLNLYGQIPYFETNANIEDSTRSIVLKTDLGQYDFVISYMESSYWSRTKLNLHIVALRKNKWFYINIRNEYKNVENYGVGQDEILSSNSTQHKLSNSRARKLFKVLNENRLWTLNTDSLHIYEKKINDSTIRELMVTDGPTSKFELITNSKFRIVSAYYPRYYIKEIPEIYTRQNFINCQEAFRKIVIAKYNRYP